MAHYFTDNTDMAENRRVHEVEFGDRIYSFTTDNGVFSKTGADRGSMILLKAVLKGNDVRGDVLDLGCGYGLIGVIVKKEKPDVRVTAADINPRAAELAALNAEASGVKTDVRVSDSFSQIPEQFDCILVNPPIRAGKQVIYHMFEEAYEHLRIYGTLYTAIRRKQGAESAVRKLEEVFGNCEIVERDKGYWVLKNTRLTDGK
ncbi:MAG: class I SAM-dependent methyltransferase [Solobacterium sp.]|nr:class I SAM-dependent methyltransferase [Solobacterium sp.]